MKFGSACGYAPAYGRLATACCAGEEDIASVHNQADKIFLFPTQLWRGVARAGTSSDVSNLFCEETSKHKLDIPHQLNQHATSGEPPDIPVLSSSALPFEHKDAESSVKQLYQALQSYQLNSHKIIFAPYLRPHTPQYSSPQRHNVYETTISFLQNLHPLSKDSHDTAMDAFLEASKLPLHQQPKHPSLG
ncbi:hypothetical protein HZ326_22586 [Fusarium oxysporum f. sp. albedinis]|nr:hypothetical protein HZ326_22586 [Fusarium oxysporum f. sp. albedinis]